MALARIEEKQDATYKRLEEFDEDFKNYKKKTDGLSNRLNWMSGAGVAVVAVFAWISDVKGVLFP